jgi:hypothetical protein
MCRPSSEFALPRRACQVALRFPFARVLDAAGSACVQAVLSSGGEVTVCEPGGLKSYDMSALINKENEQETYPSALGTRGCVRERRNPCNGRRGEDTS